MLHQSSGQPRSGLLLPCGPSGKNVVTPAVAAQVATGRTVRASNLDRSGMHIICKGARVSYECRHYSVLRVRRGVFIGALFDAFGHARADVVVNGYCRDCQVIA